MMGFALGSIGEVQFSWVGLVYGVLSSVFVALYGIHVKIAAPEVNNDTWYALVDSILSAVPSLLAHTFSQRILMAYNSEMSMVAMVPLILISGAPPALS
jgi:hypothetical protein